MKMELIASGRLPHEVLDHAGLFGADWHGNGAGAHNNSQPELIFELLSRFPAGRCRLYLAGDIVDLAEDSWPRIFRHNELLFMEIAGYRGVQVEGNHDPDLSRYLYTVGGYGLDVCQTYKTRHLYMSHGNEFDPWCSGPGGIIGLAAARAWGGIEYIGLADRMMWLRRWASRRIPTASRRGEDNTLWKEKAAARSETVVVGGHTHDPELAEIAPGRFYLNPGSGVEPGELTFGLIEGRRIELWKLTA